MPSHTLAERRKKRIPSSPAAKSKIGTVLGEFKRGTLRSGSGAKVTSRQQALAIAFSEARGLCKKHRSDHKNNRRVKVIGKMLDSIHNSSHRRKR